MTPIDAIREIADRRTAKAWEAYLLSQKLVSLRLSKGLTQKEVGKRCGLASTSVRNYEIRRAFPTEHHLELLAQVYNVRPEALHRFEFGVEGQLFSAVCQLGETYGLEPAVRKEFAYLRPTNAYMERALEKWAYQHDGFVANKVSREDYLSWMDSFAGPYDPAEFPARYVDGKPIEPWQNICVSGSLKALRSLRGLSQDDLAEASGIKVATIRSYEQGKRLPKVSATEQLAEALGVSSFAFQIYNFDTPIQAVHALFQLAMLYGLKPDVVDGQPMLRTTNRGLEEVIERWNHALEKYRENGDDDAYFLWKCSYQEVPHGSPLDWNDFESRYSRHSVFDENAMLTRVDYVSEYDPDPMPTIRFSQLLKLEDNQS